MATGLEHFPECRAAFSLNNTGVQLLGQHCYRQGLETLSDAVAAMNGAYERVHSQHFGSSSTINSSPANEDGTQTHELALQRLIRQAAHRIARPDASNYFRFRTHVEQVYQQSRSPQQQQRSCIPLLEPVIVTDIDIPTDLDIDRTSGVSTGFPDGQSLFAHLPSRLVRIEAPEFLSSSSSSSSSQAGASLIQFSYSLYSSILLHNLGVAYRLCASISEATNDQQQPAASLNASALRLLNLSYSLLATNFGGGSRSRQQHFPSSSGSNEAKHHEERYPNRSRSSAISTMIPPHEVRQRVALMAQLVLYNLVQLTTENNAEEQFREYETRFRSVQQASQQFHQQQQQQEQEDPAAGAA